MHEVDEPLEVLDRRVREHTVPEVEHVAVSRARPRQDVARLRLDDVPRAEQRRRASSSGTRWSTPIASLPASRIAPRR
jgi:hypothetical protein